MVRLETVPENRTEPVPVRFTFQYGQIRNVFNCLKTEINKIIYIPVWLDQKPFMNCINPILLHNLHSSMVRLETIFSFLSFILFSIIYIPVWLDQKLAVRRAHITFFGDLHSSMVRLETRKIKKIILGAETFTFQYGQIRN